LQGYRQYANLLWEGVAHNAVTKLHVGASGVGVNIADVGTVLPPGVGRVSVADVTACIGAENAESDVRARVAELTHALDKMQTADSDGGAAPLEYMRALNALVAMHTHAGTQHSLLGRPLSRLLHVDVVDVDVVLDAVDDGSERESKKQKMTNE
jgi:hypothetical protein